MRTLTFYNDSLFNQLLFLLHSYPVVQKGGSMCLYMAKHGHLSKIGEFCYLFSETPNMSEPNAEFLAEHANSVQQV